MATGYRSDARHGPSFVEYGGLTELDEPPPGYYEFTGQTDLCRLWLNCSDAPFPGNGVDPNTILVPGDETELSVADEALAEHLRLGRILS